MSKKSRKKKQRNRTLLQRRLSEGKARTDLWYEPASDGVTMLTYCEACGEKAEVLFGGRRNATVQGYQQARQEARCRHKGVQHDSRGLPLAGSHKYTIVCPVDYELLKHHTWRSDEDGHVVRDITDEYGEPAVIYLCNEVMSRVQGIPLEEWGPPTRAFIARRKLAAKWLIRVIRCPIAYQEPFLLNAMAEEVGLEPALNAEDEAGIKALMEKLVNVVQDAVQRADDGLLDTLVRVANDEVFEAVDPELN